MTRPDDASPRDYWPSRLERLTTDLSWGLIEPDTFRVEMKAAGYEDGEIDQFIREYGP